jgi:hypothetical protein
MFGIKKVDLAFLIQAKVTMKVINELPKWNYTEKVGWRM